MTKNTDNSNCELDGLKTVEATTLCNKLKEIEEKISQLKLLHDTAEEHDGRIQTLEARVQASVDLTDDIVGNANNLIATTESRVDKTLSNADMVLEHADFLSSTFLVILGLIVTIGSVAVTWVLGRRQEQHLRDAITRVTDKLSKDGDFKEEFIQSLISHEKLRDNIDYSIKEIARNIVERANSLPSEEDVKSMKDELDFSGSMDTNFSAEPAIPTEKKGFIKRIMGFFKNGT